MSHVTFRYGQPSQEPVLAETESSSKVMVVGSGWQFTSGISHYTYRLTRALSEELPASALLIRKLVPRRMYPGASRVGAQVTDAVYPEHVPVYDGVDWYWGRSMREAKRFISEQRPDVLILQWWTGAVLHTYNALAGYAVHRGTRVILEWHEGQDVGEAALPGTRQYVRLLMPHLLAKVSAHIVHSEFDLEAITSTYGLPDRLFRVIPHGSYDHLVKPMQESSRLADEPFRLLYLGVVRPFKGVEDLVQAFSALTRAEAERFRLTIVGETWEGWTAPSKAIAQSPHSDLIERVDRYVTDAELAEYFSAADAVVLPYHRSSASGPLQIAMSAGLPVVVSAVGGLIEAVKDYEGAVLIPPQDPIALSDALLSLPKRRGQRYSDPHSWQHRVRAFRTLIDDFSGEHDASYQRGSK
jgi:glycosyltransferase involved in cell wall biosynthesis